MYSIYADGACIYSDVFALESMKVLNPKLVLEDNGAGSLSMKLPPMNVGYSSIVRMITDISVQKDGEEIWAGRVLSESKDFWNNRDLYCEGEMAFFNDSSQPPAEYSGLSVRAYLERLIAVHNSKVTPNRRFTLGAVTVVDKNFPTYYTNYEKTMAILNTLYREFFPIDRQLHPIQIGIHLHRMFHSFAVRNYSPIFPVIHSNVQHRNILTQKCLKIIKHIFRAAIIVHQPFIINVWRSLLATGRTEINEIPLCGADYERPLHDSGQIIFEIQLLPLHGKIKYLWLKRLQTRIGTGTELTDY